MAGAQPSGQGLQARAGLQGDRGTQDAADVRKAEVRSPHSCAPQRLFSRPPYQCSLYDQAQVKARLDRCLSVAQQRQVADADFVASHVFPSARCPWASFPAGTTYTHPPEPYNAAAEAEAAERRDQRDACIAQRPFVPACAGAHLGTAPTVSLQGEQLAALAETVAADWEGVEVEVYANAAGFWVVKVALASVESAAGLAAYMATLLRRHAALHGVRLAKVPQHWGERIGDGCAYYALRPPWLACDQRETFYALHPQERAFRASEARHGRGAGTLEQRQAAG